MKKTLVALLALGSVAMADTATLNFDMGNVAATDTSAISLVSKGENTWTDLLWRNLNNANTVSRDAPVITLASGSGWTAIMQDGSAVGAGLTASAAGISIGSAANTVVTYTLAVDSILDGQNGTVTSLTFGVDFGANTDTYYGIYSIKADGTTTQLKQLTAGAKQSAGSLVENTYEDLELVSGDKLAVVFRDGNAATDIISTLSISGKMTPEPATATLSLLALAGLASRRRRH